MFKISVERFSAVRITSRHIVDIDSYLQSLNLPSSLRLRKGASQIFMAQWEGSKPKSFTSSSCQRSSKATKLIE